MLPDFPNIKADLHKLIERRLRYRAKIGDPVVAMTRQSFQHEGDGMVYNTTEGAQKEVDYNKIESSFSFSRDQIKSLKIEDILKKVDSAAQELSDHMARTIFAAIERGTKEAGTQVDAGGRPFLPEVLFDALEKISIDFDEETGEPLMPSVFVSPEVAAQIQDKLPEWERNEEYKKRHDEIMKRKYEEWNARESNRKLVD